MSTFADAFTALKNVILMQDKLERMQKEIGSTAADVLALKDYAVQIDKRVTRIEGVMEGVERASAMPRRPRLTKK